MPGSGGGGDWNPRKKSARNGNAGGVAGRCVVSPIVVCCVCVCVSQAYIMSAAFFSFFLFFFFRGGGYIRSIIGSGACVFV